MLQSIQKNVTWRAIPAAGLAAGTVFLFSNAVLTPAVMQVDAVLILRYFGSLVMGDDVLLESSTAALIAGVIVNYVLAILFTLVIAIVVHRWGLLVGIVGGALLGLAIYGINLYAVTVQLEWFNWFLAINSNVLLLSHVLFGATAGGVYEMFDHFDLPLALEVHDEAA